MTYALFDVHVCILKHLLPTICTCSTFTIFSFDNFTVAYDVAR